MSFTTGRATMRKKGRRWRTTRVIAFMMVPPARGSFWRRYCDSEHVLTEDTDKSCVLRNYAKVEDPVKTSNFVKLNVTILRADDISKSVIVQIIWGVSVLVYLMSEHQDLFRSAHLSFLGNHLDCDRTRRSYEGMLDNSRLRVVADPRARITIPSRTGSGPERETRVLFCRFVFVKSGKLD